MQNDPVLCPIGHRWDSLTCRMCGAVRTAEDAVISLAASNIGWDMLRATQLADALRAEVEAAFVKRLAKEAGGCCQECDAVIDIARHLTASDPARTEATD
jgi:hypothetical protein